MKDRKLIFSFEPSPEVKLVRWDDLSDDVRVEGVLTTRGDENYPGKLLSRKKVGLVVSLYHNRDGSDGGVYKVRKTGP